MKCDNCGEGKIKVVKLIDVRTDEVVKDRMCFCPLCEICYEE